MDLTTVKSDYLTSSSQDKYAKLLTKKVRSKEVEKFLPDSDERLSLELISRLMKEVEKKLGIQFEVLIYRLNKKRLVVRVPEWLLTYNDRSPRKSLFIRHCLANLPQGL